MVMKLKAAGYNVVMTAVYSAKEGCMAAGTKRELREGKKYHNYTWPLAMRQIPKLFR